jgi:hypothetical protein
VNIALVSALIKGPESSKNPQLLDSEALLGLL